jgi:hypothetical protein
MTEDFATYDAVMKIARRECDTCARCGHTSQVCPMPKIDINTCLSNPSRPFWRPKSGAPCGICKNDDGHDIKKCVECNGENSNFDPTSDYTQNSLVSKKSDRIDELVDAHWNYMEKVLSTGQDKSQTFTWDQVMAMRKWDYTSSAKHFYGHGYEDAESDFA